MSLPSPLDTLAQIDLDVLVGKLETARFAAGDCIFHAGSPGDACFIIDEGEVRLEIPRPELDSEGVLGYLSPGTILGELALLDEQPRSASAYAESEVVARRLTRDAVSDLAIENPRVGAAILRALGRDAARKLRQTTERLAEHIFTDAPDPEVDAMVERAQAAQRAFDGWSEERVDALLLSLAEAVAGNAESLARDSVVETKVGNVADKTQKNVLASLGVYRSIAGAVGRGPVREIADRDITEIASPAGVIFGLVPMTNPVATAIFKTLISLKGRNALILSFQRACFGVGTTLGELLQGVLKRHGAPEDLVQWVRSRTSRRKTMRFMSHPGVSLVLATGGAGMVRAAYSSGTPAIGVGSGNAPAFVTADANIDRAAAAIVASKSFDNGLICGAEHNIVVDAAVAERLTAALEQAGAAVLRPNEAKRFLAGAVSKSTNSLDLRMIGQDAARIAAFAGIVRDHPIRTIVVPCEPDFDSPITGEKMAPLLSFFTVSSEAEGLALCRKLLEKQGTGHTAIIHASNPETIRRFGEEMPASRILVNSPGSQGVCGSTTGLVPSFTLGCGTFGGNSTTDNVTYTNLQNVKRVARLLTERELPGAVTARPGRVAAEQAPTAG
jgi:acyl-CoA reductase-like NAD-dependent aldehyde dehydrogenase